MGSTQEITLLVAVVLLVGAGIIAGIGANIRKDTTGQTDSSVTTCPPRGKARKLGSRLMNPKLKTIDAGMLCAEVATRLVAGASIERAWEVSLRRLHPDLDYATAWDFAQHPQGDWWQRWFGKTRIETKRHPLADLKHREATAGALRAMFIATTVSAEVGAPLAEILTRVADGIAAQLEAAAKRHAAQVGPRATARLLGVLPLAALVMASFIGVDVVGMALSGGLNTGIFVVGAVLMVVGNLWSQAMIRRAMNPPVRGLDPTLAMDIIAACQENGVSLTASLEAVSAASDESDLGVVARMLLLGATWEEAWAGADGKWEQLSVVLQPAWEEGASPVPLLVRGAARTRAHLTHEAVNAAEKLGVRLVVPLGVCLLPAFFALGIVPVVVSTLEALLAS